MENLIGRGIVEYLGINEGIILKWGLDRYRWIFLFTVIGLTPSGSSTLYMYTTNTQNNTMKQNTKNVTYITIRIHKHTQHITIHKMMKNVTKEYKRM
jgi:uncharacterized membrane protein